MKKRIAFVSAGVLVTLFGCASSPATEGSGPGAADSLRIDQNTMGAIANFNAALASPGSNRANIVNAAQAVVRASAGTIRQITQADLASAENIARQAYVETSPDSVPRPVICHGRIFGKTATSAGDNVEIYPTYVRWQNGNVSGGYNAGKCLRGLADTRDAGDGVMILNYFWVTTPTPTPCVNVVSRAGEMETCVAPIEVLGERLVEWSQDTKESIRRGLNENLNMNNQLAVILAVVLVCILIVGSAALAI